MERVRFQSKYCFWIEVCTRSLTLALSQSLYVLVSLNLSLLYSAALFQTLLPAVFYQILSQGASYKTNRAHQDRAPEDRFGQPSLICCGSGWVKGLGWHLSSTSDWECSFKISTSNPSRLECFAMKMMAKGTWAVVLNQQSYPETLDKHTTPGFVSGLVGLWGRKVCA